MAYKFTRRPNQTIADDVVIDLSNNSTVPMSDPGVQAALAAGQILPADAAVPVYSDRQVITPRRLRTTNATPAEIFRHTIPAATEYTVRATIRAIDDGISQIRLTCFELTVARGPGNGAVFIPTRVGAQNTELKTDRALGVTAAALALPTFTIERAIGAPVSDPTNDVVIRVTGVAGPVNWLLTLSYETFAPLGA